MATFNELMQKMVNTDYEELVSFARQSTNNLMPHCRLNKSALQAYFHSGHCEFSAMTAFSMRRQQQCREFPKFFRHSSN